jgi:hypothetical protein
MIVAGLRQARANPVLRASLVWHVLPPCNYYLARVGV